MNIATRNKMLRRVLQHYHHLQSHSIVNIHRTEHQTTLGENLILLKSALDEAIAQLPLKYRRLVVLKYIADVPVDKIMSMTGFRFRVDYYRHESVAFSHLIKLIPADYFEIG